MRDKNFRNAWTAYFEARGAGAAQSIIDTPRITAINFMVDAEPIPQGSMSGVCTTRTDGSPVTILKADNKRTHAFRNQVGFAALEARAAAGIHGVFAGAGLPVRVAITFAFERPRSAPASRIRPTVKPDVDKLARACMDALTGVLYEDDGQVVDCELHKIYSSPARVQISVQLVQEEEK
jgi:Holliday junction resolvase RusA-like endonuclease